jgi:Leucine-rich repeat (LRR) protein
LPGLHTLSISHNRLQALDDIRELTECHNLAILDLSYNQLEDPQIVQVTYQQGLQSFNLSNSLNTKAEFPCVDVIAYKTITALLGWLQIFGSMNNLRVLTLTGNPVLRKISYYRNVLIVECVST